MKKDNLKNNIAIGQYIYIVVKDNLRILWKQRGGRINHSKGRNYVNKSL